VSTVIEALSCGITYNCHSNDSRGVIYDHNILKVQDQATVLITYGLTTFIPGNVALATFLICSFVITMFCS